MNAQRKVDKAVAAEGQAREREGLAMGRLKKVMEVSDGERRSSIILLRLALLLGAETGVTWVEMIFSERPKR